MPTRDQVRTLLSRGLDYRAAGRQLGIPAGQAYLIATGRPADGSDAPPAGEQEGGRGRVPASSRQLANPPAETPTASTRVMDWIAARVAADGQMRAAAARRPPGPDEPASPGGSGRGASPGRPGKRTRKTD